MKAIVKEKYGPPEVAKLMEIDKPLLTKNGIYISTELGKNAKNVYLALITPIFGGKRILFPIPTINTEEKQNPLCLFTFR